MHRRRLAGIVVAVVIGSLVLGAGSGPAVQEAAGEPPADRLVSPTDDGSHVWPYTSRHRSVDGRTLAINVVILDDPDRVRRVLGDRTDANWSAEHMEEDELQVITSPWGRTHGSSRYTYVKPGGANGQWKDADYQLGVGDYLGRQIHVRAYTVPDARATALQAHTEYWDWFRLRHTVTGLEPGMRFVEQDLRSTPGEPAISREYHGLDGGRNDGWISVVDLDGRSDSATDVQRGSVPTGITPASVGVLIAVLPVVALSSFRSWSVGRGAGNDVLLAAGLASVVIGVRTAGIVFEGLLPTVDPKYFSIVLYPVLALAPLAVVRQFAPGRPPERAAVLAAAGFGAGLVVDLGMVNVAALPVDVVLHRIALVGALAVVAMGASRRDRQLTALGVGTWVLVLVAQLAGVV